MTLPFPLCKLHMSSMRRYLILSLLATSICHQNSFCLWLFFTALISWLTLTYGIVTSQPLFYSVLMSFFKATYTTWHACYNTWYTSLNSTISKVTMTTISLNWISLANLPRSLYLQFLNLVGTSCTHWRILLFKTISLLILEVSRPPIELKRIPPTPRYY